MSFFKSGAARNHGSNKTFSRNNRQQTNLTTEDQTSQQKPDYQALRSKFKTAIVIAAIWGLIPRQMAEFLIKVGGLAND